MAKWPTRKVLLLNVGCGMWHEHSTVGACVHLA